MKKFILIFRGGNVPADQQEKTNQDWFAWIGGLATKGVYKSGYPLAGGRVVTAAGTKAYKSAHNDVAGYGEIEATSLDVAVKIAKTAPNVKDGGTVEVREAIPM